MLLWFTIFYSEYGLIDILFLRLFKGLFVNHNCTHAGVNIVFLVLNLANCYLITRPFGSHCTLYTVCKVQLYHVKCAFQHI